MTWRRAVAWARRRTWDPDVVHRSHHAPNAGSDKGKRWTRKALDDGRPVGRDAENSPFVREYVRVGNTERSRDEGRDRAHFIGQSDDVTTKEITRFVATQPEVVKMTKDRKLLAVTSRMMMMMMMMNYNIGRQNEATATSIGRYHLFIESVKN